MNHSQPIGIYVHIPFCVRKCLYCDFLSFPIGENGRETQSKSLCDAYLEALQIEICSASKMVNIKNKASVQSVYIGGGTPSILNEVDITNILCQLRSCFLFTEDIEITIEVNPGTVTKEKLDAYRKAGVNRLSIGLQSAKEDELKRLGRIHCFQEFLYTYQAARDAGFQNVNIDLMTALPSQTMEDLIETLNQMIALQPEHVSAYSLIIEEGTPYAKMYREEQLPCEELDRDMYAMTGKLLAAAGLHRYEISNYAREGYESRHNSAYWKRTPYLGIGLGASSLLDETRWKNEADIQAYIRQAMTAHKPKRYEEQILTRQMQTEEYMFLRLRMTCGISTSHFEETFHQSVYEVYGDRIQKLLDEGLMEKYVDGGMDMLRLSLRGIDLSNYVFSCFL